MRHGLTAVLLTCVVASCTLAVPPVHLMHIDGQIDPAVAGYVKSGITNAADAGAQAVLIRMDTPGGLMTSMQDIIKTIFASEVPTIVYVAPNGATAASAGTFITMAADIAAMAPVSNIGSASPVNISPEGKSEEMPKTMKRKVENFAVEYARSIAQRRGRNAQWAEKAVRGAENITASKALEIKVIDYVAESNTDLLKKIDGRKVKLSTGKTLTLKTKDAPIQEVPMGTWDTFLHYLSNPAVVLFLTMAATFGIIYELSNPGLIFPGVVGAICVLLLLYSYSVLPVSAAGLAFVVLAVGLFVIDLFTPTHGVLTAGAVISLFLGLVMLFRSAEGFMVSIWSLVAVTAMTTAFFVFIVGMGIRALNKPYVSGREGVVGHMGEARTRLAPTGKVFVDGSLWTATSESGDIEKGQQVFVVSMQGLRLKVRRHTETQEDNND